MSPSKFIHFIFTKSPFCVRPLGIYPCLHGAYILEEMNVQYYDSYRESSSSKAIIKGKTSDNFYFHFIIQK